MRGREVGGWGLGFGMGLMVDEDEDEVGILDGALGPWEFGDQAVMGGSGRLGGGGLVG